MRFVKFDVYSIECLSVCSKWLIGRRGIFVCKD